MVAEKVTKSTKQTRDSEKAKEKKRPSEPAVGHVDGATDGLAASHTLLETYVIGLPVETHVALFGDTRLSRPANAGRKAQMLSSLQHSQGNAYVQRLLKSRTVQAKLTVNPPDDQYEKEADRVANTVERMPNSKIQRQQAMEKATESEKKVEAMFPGLSAESKASAQAQEEKMMPFFYDPKSAKQKYHLLADRPEGVGCWEDIGKKEGPYWVKYSYLGKPTERLIDWGTKIQNVTFIMKLPSKNTKVMELLDEWRRKGWKREGSIVYRYGDTVCCLDESSFFKNIEVGKGIEEVSKHITFTRAVTVAYQYGTLTLMLLVRPDLLIDVAGNIISGNSIVDEEAMRGYLASLLTGPLGAENAGKVVKILVKNVVAPAVQSAFKQVLGKGKIEPGKMLQDILIGAISNAMGKAISRLPSESQSLLEKVFGSKEVREQIGSVIAMEVNVVLETGKEAVPLAK